MGWSAPSVTEPIRTATDFRREEKMESGLLMGTGVKLCGLQDNQKLYVMLFDLRGIFVTGTDTGVGKTWAATHLIRELRRQVPEVHPLKPVESGCVATGNSGEGLQAQDAQALCEAAQLAETESVVRYKLRTPIAPMLAARQEGVEFRLQDLVDFCRREGLLVVEGAGGWRTPLAEDGDVQALASELGLPVLVVAEDRLGAINQVLLTCEAVQKSHCQLAGVILNQLKPGAGDFGNFPVLESRLGEVPVWQTRHEQWLDEKQARHLMATFVTMPVGC